MGAGDPSHQKLEAVCTKCNNGWMSQIQNRASVPLKQMLVGAWPDFSPEEQCDLASWASMFTMTVEFLDPPTVCASSEERFHLAENQEPPPDWQVFLCKVIDGHAPNFIHRAFVYLLDEHRSEALLVNLIQFGEVAFVVLKLPRALAPFDGHLREDMNRAGAFKLWPVISNNANFLPRRLTDEEFESLDNGLVDAISQVGHI